MFENLKVKLARLIIRRKYLKKNIEPIVFNNIISQSVYFLVILPGSEKEFIHSFELIRFLIIHRKSVTLFLPEHKYNLIPEKERYKFIVFNPLQKTKLNLPDPSLIESLQNKTFDVVIDLNRQENIFFSAVANIVKSRLRICFNKEYSGAYYNFLFADSQENPEVAYRNMLNFLQMF